MTSHILWRLLWALLGAFEHTRRYGEPADGRNAPYNQTFDEVCTNPKSRRSFMWAGDVRNWVVSGRILLRGFELPKHTCDILSQARTVPVNGLPVPVDTPMDDRPHRGMPIWCSRLDAVLDAFHRGLWRIV